ncbi:MAG: hypothetical protein RSE13_06225 [Planktothrix sp. GU0601_MAG3]|nr:MAG: hypothetical protein RSE13_06225 [Planktothrix sp. GU0601_MAG3]
MKIFCIDPFLLAYPRFNENTNNSSEEFDSYLNTLIAWGDFIDSNRETENIYVSLYTAEILAKVNGYPEWTELEQVITHLNFNHIQPQDILNVINNILNLSSIEDKINIKEILYDYKQVQCDPFDYLLEREDDFQETYYRIAILEHLLETLVYGRVVDKLLATRHNTNNSKIIKLKAEILDYELIDESKISTLNKSYLVETELISCVDPEHLSTFFYPSISEEILDRWKKSTSEKGYCDAIETYVMKIYVDDLKSKLKQPLSWLLGSKFLETVKKLGFTNEDTRIKMLLRSCAETILEENLKDTHWLRTGKGAKNPQRERKKDEAKAWRRDIDYEYHLHYWKKTNNEIEFASIVIHNDMKIPE